MLGWGRQGPVPTPACRADAIRALPSSTLRSVPSSWHRLRSLARPPPGMLLPAHGGAYMGHSGLHARLPLTFCRSRGHGTPAPAPRHSPCERRGDAPSADVLGRACAHWCTFSAGLTLDLHASLVPPNVPDPCSPFSCARLLPDEPIRNVLVAPLAAP
jgi:hypothetical protein